MKLVGLFYKLEYNNTLDGGSTILYKARARDNTNKKQGRIYTEKELEQKKKKRFKKKQAQYKKQKWLESLSYVERQRLRKKKERPWLYKNA